MMISGNPYLIRFVLVSLISGALTCQAQDSGVVIIEEDPVTPLLDHYLEYRSMQLTADGYRVQILSATSRDAADERMEDFEQDHPEHAMYLTYTSPYFKIRVGDFTERLSAYRFLQEVKRDYPGAFLVEERVLLSIPED